MTAPDRTKVLVADDEEGARDVLKVLLATEPDMQLVGSAPDAETAIELAARTEPRPTSSAGSPGPAELVFDDGSFAAQALFDALTMRAVPPFGAIKL